MFIPENPSEHSPLIRIASELAQQCEELGRIGLATSDWTPDYYVDHIAQHVSVVRALLTGFEKVTPIVISDSDRPYLVFPTPEHISHAPGGMCRHNRGISPRTYLELLLAAWTYQIVQKEKDATHWLPLRGALWVIAQHGLHEGIRYLFSLAKYGWLIHRKAFATALELLVRASCFGTDRDTVLPLFFPVLPATPMAWHEQLIKLSPTLLEQHVDRCDDAVLELILSESLDRMNATSRAHSYTSWLSSQLTLDPILSAVICAVQSISHSPSPTLTMVLDQFKEAIADSGGLCRLIISKLSFSPLIYDSSLASILVRTLKATLGDEWKTQAMARPSIPVGLLDLFEADQMEDVPEHWRLASPQVAWPLATCFRTEIPTTILRSARIPRELVLKCNQTKALVDSLCTNGADAERHEAVIEAVSDFPSSKPSPRLFRKMMQELKSLGESRGGTQHALAPPGDRYSAEVEDWFEAHYDAIQAAVRDFVMDYWKAEITECICSAQQLESQDHNAALRVLRDAVKLYPWCEFIHYELSICCDRHGHPDESIEAITNALLLRPDYHLLWQSLGVILRGQGHVKHGTFASVMSQYLSSQATE